MFRSILLHATVIASLLLTPLPDRASPPKVSSYAAMREAIESDDSAKLEILLKQGPDVNLRDKRGLTLLMRAVANWKSDSIKLLLDHGADPNLTDQDGRSALMIAFQWSAGDTSPGDPGPRLAAQLLDRGAKIDLKNKEGMTPLMVAAGWHHPASVEFLLDHGANVQLRDRRGRTPLTWAARDGANSQSVRSLRAKGAVVGVLEAVLMADKAAALSSLSKGIGISTRGPYGETALIAAAEMGDLWMVQALLDHGMDPNAHDDLGLSALILALCGRIGHYVPSGSPHLPANPNEPARFDIVRALLEYGAQPNYRVTTGLRTYEHLDRATALRLAISVSPTSTVKYLIDNGADVGIGARANETPLLDAIDPPFNLNKFKSRPDTVRYLVEKAEQLNRKPAGWNAALMKAVEFPEILTFLLDHGAEVNGRDRAGKTALMRAAEIGNLSVAQLLLSRGANIRLRDKMGCSALTYAANTALFREDQHLVPYLRDRGAPYQLIDAVLLDDQSAVRAMLESGASPNVQNGDRDSALMKAANEGNAVVVGLLLKHGARPNWHYGRIPVNLLASLIDEKNREYTVKTLIAKKQNPQNWMETARLLVSAGAQVNPSHAGMSEWDFPLVVAISYDDEPFVRFLLQNHADPRTRFKGIAGDIRSVLDLAKERGKTEIIALLEQAIMSRKGAPAHR